MYRARSVVLTGDLDGMVTRRIGVFAVLRLDQAASHSALDWVKDMLDVGPAGDRVDKDIIPVAYHDEGKNRLLDHTQPDSWGSGKPGINESGAAGAWRISSLPMLRRVASHRCRFRSDIPLRSSLGFQPSIQLGDLHRSSRNRRCGVLSHLGLPPLPAVCRLPPIRSAGPKCQTLLAPSIAPHRSRLLAGAHRHHLRTQRRQPWRQWLVICLDPLWIRPDLLSFADLAWPRSSVDVVHRNDVLFLCSSVRGRTGVSPALTDQPTRKRAHWPCRPGGDQFRLPAMEQSSAME